MRPGSKYLMDNIFPSSSSPQSRQAKTKPPHLSSPRSVQKEKKFLALKEKKKNEKISVKLATVTNARLIRLLSKMVPDHLSVRTTFMIWKDCTEYDRSMQEDGGESYRLSHMSLMDIKMANNACSVGMSTRKLNFSLGAEFDAEDAEEQKEKQKNEKNQDMIDQVLMEAAKAVPSGEDVVTEELLRSVRDMGKMAEMSEGERIRRSLSTMSSVTFMNQQVANRRGLRTGLLGHFQAMKEKENKEHKMPEYKYSSDEEDQTISGFEGMATIGSLAALESVRMLALPRGHGSQGSRSKGRRSSVTACSDGGEGGGKSGALNIKKEASASSSALAKMRKGAGSSKAGEEDGRRAAFVAKNVSSGSGLSGMR